MDTWKPVPQPDRIGISETLAEALAGSAAEPSIGELVHALGKSSFGIVLVLFGLPNLLPVPGLPILCGVLIGIVAVQMVLGWPQILLPRWLAERRLSRAALQASFARARPSLLRIERILQPRFGWLIGRFGEQFAGFVLILLSVALMAPIPFFGGIAPGLAVIFIGLGFATRDGGFVLAGYALAVVALVITIAISYAIMVQILRAVARIF